MHKTNVNLRYIIKTGNIFFSFCTTLLLYLLLFTARICVNMSRKEEDILLKQDIDDLVAKYPDRLRVVYYLSNCSSKSWDNLPNCKKGVYSF